MSAKHKRKRSAARPVAPGRLGFIVEQQPDDETCGPACLHGLYRHYGDEIRLERVVADIHMLDKGGTLDVFLANHALKRGYDATILTYNLDLVRSDLVRVAERRDSRAACRPSEGEAVASLASGNARLR